MSVKAIQVNNTSIHVDLLGSGPSLMLVHGFPLDRTMWADVTNVLAQSFQLVIPDLPGFGASPLPPWPLTPANYAQTLALLLTELKITSPIAICGLSMGGYIALEFWHQHPQRLNALILTNTKASADSPDARDNREQAAQKVLANGTTDLARSMPEKLLSEKSLAQSPELKVRISEMIEHQSPESIAAASRGMAQRHDFTDRLDNISIPTLVIAGEDDKLIPLDESKRMDHMIPNASMKLISAAGHLSPLEQPTVFTQTVSQFLSSHA